MSLRPTEPKVSSRFDYVLRVGLEAGANASLPTLDQISINATSDERVPENVMNKNDNMNNDDIGADSSNPGDGDWNRQPGMPRRQSSARAEGQVRGVVSWSRQGHGRYQRARIDPQLQNTIDTLTSDRERIIRESQEAARRDRQLIDRLAEENAELRAAQEENARIIAGTGEEIDRLQSELADTTRQLEDTDRELARRARIEDQIAELVEERNEAFARFEDNVKNATQEMIDRVQQQLESHLTSLLESKCEADLKQSQETVKLLTDKLASLQSNSGMKTREVVERVVERQALELDEIRKVIAMTNPEQFAQELRKAVIRTDVPKVKALLKYGANPYSFTPAMKDNGSGVVDKAVQMGEPLLPSAALLAIMKHGMTEGYPAMWYYNIKDVAPGTHDMEAAKQIVATMANAGVRLSQQPNPYKGLRDGLREGNSKFDVFHKWMEPELVKKAFEVGLMENGREMNPIFQNEKQRQTFLRKIFLHVFDTSTPWGGGGGGEFEERMKLFTAMLQGGALDPELEEDLENLVQNEDENFKKFNRKNTSSGYQFRSEEDFLKDIKPRYKELMSLRRKILNAYRTFKTA